MEKHCEAVPLADFDVHYRVSIRCSSMSGRTVEEYEPVDSKAIYEMEQLYLLAFGDDHDNAA